MQKLQKDLQDLKKTLKMLTQKVEKIQAQIDKTKKPTSAKPKTVKKGAVKPAKGKKPLTAADTVLAVISRRKKGINTAALMEKTGYDKKKIANIIFKLKKQGQIKTPVKGEYVKA